MLKILILFAGSFFSMADWNYPEVRDVVILSPLNFDQFLRDYEEALVYFYLPECKYCIVMDKFYSSLALEWKEKEQRIPLAKFNCQRHLSFCEEHAIPSFPYLKMYIRGHPLTYFGKRTKFHLNDFIHHIMNTVPESIDIDQFQ